MIWNFRATISSSPFYLLIRARLCNGYTIIIAYRRYVCISIVTDCDRTYTIASLQKNRGCIWFMQLYVTMRQPAATPRSGWVSRAYIGGDVSDENPDSVNFPVDGFPTDPKVPGCRPPRGTERKRNAERQRPLTPHLSARNSPFLSQLSPWFASPCTVLGSPSDVCRIIVD